MSISTITISAINYTAYASVTEADAYLAVDPVRATTWAALSTDQKGQMLVAATRRLDYFTWEGTKTGAEGVQENAWPRTSVDYPDGTAVSTSEVPIEIENATILLAGTIAITSTVANVGTSGSNIERVKAGSAEVEFFKPTTGVRLQDETAFNLIKIFFGNDPSTDVGTLASGSDEVTIFDDDFELVEGYG